MTICIAEEGERKLIEQALGQVPRDARVVVTGVGALNIIQALKDLPQDEPLLNIGYAGSANFEVGSWVQVSEVRLHHPHVSYAEPTVKFRVEGLGFKVVEGLGFKVVEGLGLLVAPCYSSTDFVLESPYKDCVFDMELAFIAALGFTHLSSIKYVSDNLSLHAYHEIANGVQ